MKVIGIVVEYNPFHNGHKYQIDKIKEKYKDSLIIVCCSSSFTQRGELSILNKWEKTKVSLENGVDIVIELPYVYSTQSSDVFAYASIKLLNMFHIDTLCFGSEEDNLNKLIKVASIQQTEECSELVKKNLNEGLNYPTSLNKAIKELTHEEVSTPNDLLAVSYIKEIIKNDYKIELYPIKRTNDFHDITLESNIVSASNIRNRLKENNEIVNQVPSNVLNILKAKEINYNKYFELLKYKILSTEDLTSYVDVTEGLDVRIKKEINKSNTLEELINNVKSKRFTYNKINRTLNHILCSFTNEENNQTKEIEYARILGFNNNGKKYLNCIKKEINILNKYDTVYKTLEIEKRVTDIYNLIMNDNSNKEIENKPIYLDN